MSKKIIFTKYFDDISDEYLPIPAYKIIPEWYKKTPSYINNNTKSLSYESLKSQTNGTIKKCMPVFDSVTSGYIILTPCDLLIRQMPNGMIEYHTSIQNAVTYHSILQAPYHPEAPNLPKSFLNFPKWTNPWAIETPSGYSCIITSPKHRDNEYFTIFDGIIDTDKYHGPINFPFTLKDPNFEGVIPAGTPMAQVLPFKRDSWKMEIGNDTNRAKTKNILSKLESVFFDRYKSLFWSKKEYR